MEKKKVLFVVHQLTVGGVQKALISALDNINYEKYDVTLYVRKDRTALLSEINANVKVIVNKDGTSYYKKPYALLLQARALAASGKKKDELNEELSARIREDMMRYEKKTYFENSHYDVAVSYIQGYTAEFTAKCVNADKKIMFFHGSTDEVHDVHMRIMPFFDRIVGVNEGVKNVLCGLYPDFAEKMTYIENYVDASGIREKSGEYTVDAPKGKTVLCSCGRISRVKGFDLAAQAAKILKDSGADFIWYFVGDGPERESIEAFINENGLGENIVITGMQSNPYPYMAACDIYVQPSYEEAHPLTLIEAKILGRCIVTTGTVGGKCLCKNGETGIVTDISAEGIARGIARLINDTDLRNRISENLGSTDYEAEKAKFGKKWDELLEEA